MAGGEILLAGDALIFDDLIDEALEYFVFLLTFQDPDNVPPLALIESNGGDTIRIDIIDNDGELKHIMRVVSLEQKESCPYRYLHSSYIIHTSARSYEAFSNIHAINRVYRYLYWVCSTKYNVSRGRK